MKSPKIHSTTVLAVAIFVLFQPSSRVLAQGAGSALQFNGTNQYVTFGAAPSLGVSTMTIETWFRRDGAGATTSTGSGGVTATPLVTKGRSQADGSNVDMNYFLGVDAAGRLVADFEDRATGLNHPVTGSTAIPINAAVWRHAAATYDGTTWRLYLDGALDATSVVGAFTPRSDSIQHASIGSALNSSGAAAGFFKGAVDEIRIWDRALSLPELQANINQQITSASNLVARFGLDEGAGTTVNDSTANPVNGTLVGANPLWIGGAPFNLAFNQAPNEPALLAPANGATDQSTSPALSVTVSDPDGDPMSITFYGRPAPAGPAPDFTLVALPDTQHYSDDATRAATFTAQTQWIVNNRELLNIPFVTHLGDIVQNIDAVPVEWQRADASMDLLDGQVPYGMAPGNHDMNSAGVATNYDLTFPVSRMSGYPWYGGYLGQSLFGFTDPVNRENKDNFELFSAGGMDFIIVHLEYDMPGYAVAWANRVLAAHPTRRAIITTHLFLNASGIRPTSVLNRTTEGTPASTVWTNLIFPNCNVFLVLNGHYSGEANRTDANSCGQPVHQVVADYQDRANGGDGWLRYLTFKPAENKVYVYTYSPTLGGGSGLFETDASSQFVLDYNMSAPFTAVATNPGVASGASTSSTWPGRALNTRYEWYATASDGLRTTAGPTWTFTTTSAASGAPTATPQSVTTDEDLARSLTLSGADPENDPLTFSIGAGPGHGTLTGTAPALTYTPAANYNGLDSFTFTVSDGPNTSAPATVSITVTAVSDPPTISNLGDQATTPGIPLTIGFSVGDPDSLDTLSLSGTSDNPSLIPAGSIGFYGAGASRTVTLSPLPGQVGSATITVTVTDGMTPTSDTFILSVDAGPTVSLLSPNGGEKLFAGSAYVISWNATAGAATLGSFAAQYSTNNGSSFAAVPGCTGLSAAIRQCTWAAPVATTTGRVRVIATDAAGRSGSDDSNAPFSVVSGTASVSLTSPSSNSTLAIGALRPIAWNHNVGTATFAATFTVEISRNGTTGPWTAIASGVPQLSPTTGRFDWTVAGPTASSVRFRVRPTNFTVSGTSGSGVQIANPTLTLSSPASGSTWTIGINSTFRWSTNLGSGETVKVEISRDEGVTWGLVSSSVTASTGRYTWTVSGPATTKMRARVTWNRNPGVSSQSSGNNTIR